MDERISKIQMDAMREVVSIGAGNAATALSQMVKKKIDILVPKANILALDKVADIFGGAEVLVKAVYLEILGDVSGIILFSFHKDEANRFVDLLLGNPSGTTKIINDLGQSALKEVATIISGAYLNALAKFLRMRLLISTPAFAEDMAGAIIDDILIETSKEADQFFVIDTEFEIISEKVNTYFFFIPDVESLGKIFRVLGVNS